MFLQGTIHTLQYVPARYNTHYSMYLQGTIHVLQYVSARYNTHTTVCFWKVQYTHYSMYLQGTIHTLKYVSARFNTHTTVCLCKVQYTHIKVCFCKVQHTHYSMFLHLLADKLLKHLGSFRTEIRTNGVVAMSVPPSERPSVLISDRRVTQYQPPNGSTDFHEIRYKTSLQKPVGQAWESRQPTKWQPYFSTKGLKWTCTRSFHVLDWSVWNSAHTVQWCWVSLIYVTNGVAKVILYSRLQAMPPPF